MIPLTDKQIAGYFYRSYTAVDGLWFMKLEEKYGFDTALDVDDEVWKVMPKIQARKLKSLTGLHEGIHALFKCLTTKLSIEGFEFQGVADDDENGFTITITTCPWYDLLVKSDRRPIADKVGSRVCNSEYTVWASEFGGDIRFELGHQICKGCSACVVRFRRESAPASPAS
jgi:hypothetical protein